MVVQPDQGRAAFLHDLLHAGFWGQRVAYGRKGMAGGQAGRRGKAGAVLGQLLPVAAMDEHQQGWRPGGALGLRGQEQVQPLARQAAVGMLLVWQSPGSVTALLVLLQKRAVVAADARAGRVRPLALAQPQFGGRKTYRGWLGLHGRNHWAL